MYPTNLSDIKDPVVRERIAIERRIVQCLITTALQDGFYLSVNDGMEEHPRTRDRKAIEDAILNTDEDYLIYWKDDVRIGWVFLVYGNSGWDVMSNWTTSLSAHLAPVEALALSLEPAQ